MKVAIMQPYWLPYLGYWQLIAAADAFVVYDNVKYTKAGWINRNRFLLNGEPAVFTLPLKHGADHLHVVQRQIADDYIPGALLRQLAGAYGRAPHYAELEPLLRRVAEHADRNLFAFLRHSIEEVCRHIGIDAGKIVTSSTVPIDHSLRGQNKVLAICEALGATEYVNAPGGVALYDRAEFRRRGVELKFLRPLVPEYRQFGAPFVPWLSVVDALAFCGAAKTREIVNNNWELF